MTNDTIPYAGRDWTESQIWELCAALADGGYITEIMYSPCRWIVRLDPLSPAKTGLFRHHFGPSPWPALQAAVLALETERKG